KSAGTFKISEVHALLKGNFEDVLAVLTRLVDRQYLRRLDQSKDPHERTYQVIDDQYRHQPGKDLFDVAGLSEREASVAYGRILRNQGRSVRMELPYSAACEWAEMCKGPS